jgi:hypothetical protein
MSKFIHLRKQSADGHKAQDQHYDEGNTVHYLVVGGQWLVVSG